MTTLLDLPSEILTRLPSGRSFLLHRARLHDEQWREDRATIAALARTCRKLHSIFNSVLYRSLILTSLPVAKRLQIVRTIVSQPRIAAYVEDLKLDLFIQRFPLRDSYRESIEELSADQADGDWYRFLGLLFLPNVCNLKQLAVRCVRYDRIPCDFPELLFAQVKGYCQGRGVGLDSRGIEQLLLVPKIQKLIFSGPYITEAQNLEALETAASNVSSLSLRIIMISSETLRTILRVSRHLSSFEFYSASMRAPFLEARSRDKLLTFRDVGYALQQHKDSLANVKISFPSSDSELPATIFGGLSFHNFNRLTKLSVAPEMFLGWKECVHQNRWTEKSIGPSDAITFANCLPHCLEELTIFVQQYQRARNGNGYAYDVIRGVINQRTRIYRLRSIELTCCKGVISCSQCRLAALTYLDRSATVKQTEIAQISEACAVAGIEFNWIEGMWEDS